MKELLAILFSAILVDNFVLSKFMGICPFIGVSKKTESAMGMSVAVTFVMVLSTADLPDLQIHPGTEWAGIPEHNGVYLDYCAICAAGGNPNPAVPPAALQSARHLPAADYDKLRGAGRDAAEY